MKTPSKFFVQSGTAPPKGAREYFEQALLIAHQTGNRKGERPALANLGVVYAHQGYYTEARDAMLRELEIYREIGDTLGPGLQLLNLGVVSQFVGDYAEALTFCEQALQISREIGDGRIETWSLAYLGLISHQLGDNRAAREFSQQALEIARESGAAYVQGHALLSLGHALTALGLAAPEAEVSQFLDKAEKAYQEAVTIQKTFDQPNLILEPLAGLAQVAQLQRNLDQAQIYVSEILEHLESCTLDRLDEPFRVHLTCYQILAASQNPQADEVLQEAYYCIQDRATKIQDEDMRRSYLEKIASNRTIIQQFEAGRIHSITVRLPRVDIPARRMPQEDDWVQVIWSLGIPEDEQISGKANRRKARLLRLLEEAETQGGAPRLDDLAAALEVSVPTVKRDLAQLRKAGHAVKTRGSRST
jgi:tetratricopeptide (TPR) repeat protein